MKKFLFILCPAAFLLSCNNAADKTVPAGDSIKAAGEAKPAVELPYKALYSSSFSTDVSDEDLKTVLTSYKDWADGNVKAVTDVIGDTLVFDSWDGASKTLPRAEVFKEWSAFRDSLSNVKIEMEAWHKMYSTDKKQGFIVTWYNEYDTYKNGKVDSAQWHDINEVKNGKIVYYRQYKKPLKKI